MTINAACQNCPWEGPSSECKPIKNLLERVAPGEPMPCGECPQCGALCHPSAEDDEDISDQSYRDAAEILHGRDGVCEIDADAAVSKGDDDGAYVAAWVWVPSSDAQKD